MKKEVIEKKCEKCNNIFLTNSTKKGLKKRFCCINCARSFNGKLNLGRKMTEEQKKRQSIRSMGVGNSFFAKTHSKESIDKMVDSRYKISLKRAKTCNISNLEIEVLDGILLADASLDGKSKVSSRITYGCKFKETLEEVVASFKSIKFGNVFEYTSKPHKITKKQYTGFFLKSNSYFDLLKQRARWYKNKKIIPHDVRITPTSCFWWFIGDGYCNYANVILCTECFSFEDKQILIKKLKTQGFKAKINSRGRLFFDKKSSHMFLLWILEQNKMPRQYVYKLENYNKQNKNKKYKIEL